MSEYEVAAFWDKEAKVWVATSDDVPGLVTEAETVEQLLDKLRIMIPELLEITGIPQKQKSPFIYIPTVPMWRDGTEWTVSHLN